MKKEILKKQLIKILDNSIVPYKNWMNRDTPSAQEGCAKQRMYLLAGCDFKLVYSYDDDEISLDKVKEYLKSDIETMYLSIFHYEFEDNGSWDTNYMPSIKKLEQCKKEGNMDWY